MFYTRSSNVCFNFSYSFIEIKLKNARWMAWKSIKVKIRLLGQFSVESLECRETKTQVIALTNQNSGKQYNEPIRSRNKWV